MTTYTQEEIEKIAPKPPKEVHRKPLLPRTTLLWSLSICGVSLLGYGLFLGLNWFAAERAAQKVKAEQEERGRWIRNYALGCARQVIEEHLINPAQAKEISLEAVGFEGNRILFHAIYDAPNSFGAMIRESYLIPIEFLSYGKFRTLNPNPLIEASRNPKEWEIESAKITAGWSEAIATGNRKLIEAARSEDRKNNASEKIKE